MKQDVLTEPSATIVVHEGEIHPDQPFQPEIPVPEGATHALVLVERLSGGRDVRMDLSGLTADELGELSRLEEVRARLLRVSSNTRHIAIRVASSAKAAYRVTVAFLKREAASAGKNFSCRACKQLCRLAVSTLLAHLGVPYLDAEAAGGVPVPVGDEGRALLENPGSAPEWVREMFELIHPKAIAVVRMVLGAVDWVFDATDRLYTAVCERLGMCRAAATPG